MLGTYLLALATIAAVLSTTGYFFVARGKQSYELAARWAYYLATGLVLFSTFYLFYLFLTDRFEFAYVFGYSSIDLADNYKITSLWAGQEGSFLLWVAFGVLLGLWVKAKAKEQSGWVMFFYLISQLFLFTLLNISSPFKLSNIIPIDGQGLNPLLQNFWMQIHPPIVFIGYASVFIPFSFALAALATNRYDSWVRLAFPWAVFSVFTLGAGIFIGGYWAYETLGWGGFWSWDPVENASLVPWIGSVALVHGMILERRRRSFRKTNLFLAITSFLLVIYGTFLTRSGVLADFSVHSFVNLGQNAYLVIFLVGFSVISYGMLAYRSGSIKSTEPVKSPLAREFAVFLGMLFLILSAFLILLGTSSPLITGFLSDPSAVDISYYTKTNLPIAIIITIVLGLSALFSWEGTSSGKIKTRLIVSLIISVLTAVISAIAGVANVLHLLLIFTSSFAFVSYFILSVTRFKNGFLHIRSGLVHTGFAIMFIGIVISTGYSSGEKAALNLNESEDIKGFNFTFQGIEKLSDTREKIVLVIERGSNIFTASPVFVRSRQGVVRQPCIKKYLFYDLYISPEEVKISSSDTSMSNIILSTGQTVEVDDFELTFVKFDRQSHSEDMMISIGAELEVITSQNKIEIIKPVYSLTGDAPILDPAEIPGTDKKVYLLEINADEGKVLLGITDKDSPEEFTEKPTLILEITKKPMINLVWLGLILILLGSGVSAYKRLQEIKA